ncbi:transcription initiation factor TFIID subunit 6-like isoform X2 [Alnus glutinosa]|uniref:transcription initiation factor TFIID subunit 6-like isoform X2 n=1 Tax=Alnus glutinosa TaxID=3517 RepID=UPI002D775905|nr:transcription initiation factor TFIID subunit 6-like isoform X2 [Alnus glutinosa]
MRLGELACLWSPAGQCIYDRLNMFSPQPSLSARAVWRTNARVITTPPRSTNSSSSHMEETPSPLEEKAVVPPAPSVDSNVGPSSSYRQPPNDINLDGRGRTDMRDSQALNRSAVLSQIWKNDLDSGRLLVLIFELFGEGHLSFIPAPEMSMFL